MAKSAVSCGFGHILQKKSLMTNFIFVPIASIYLESVDDGIYNNITAIMLLIEEFGSISKPFMRTSTWSDAG